MLRVPAPFRFWALGANPPIMWEKPGDINRTYGVAPVLGNQSFGKVRARRPRALASRATDER